MSGARSRSLVCIECGIRFSARRNLEQHWHDHGHGPRQVQLDAIDRARISVLGDAAPDPQRADTERRP